MFSLNLFEFDERANILLRGGWIETFRNHCLRKSVKILFNNVSLSEKAVSVDECIDIAASTLMLLWCE